MFQFRYFSFNLFHLSKVAHNLFFFVSVLVNFQFYFISIYRLVRWKGYFFNIRRNKYNKSSIQYKSASCRVEKDRYWYNTDTSIFYEYSIIKTYCRGVWYLCVGLWTWSPQSLIKLNKNLVNTTAPSFAVKRVDCQYIFNEAFVDPLHITIYSQYLT